jgi:hypothetical protein
MWGDRSASRVVFTGSGLAAGGTTSVIKVSFLGLGTDAAIATSIPSRQLFSCDDFQLRALH